MNEVAFKQNLEPLAVKQLAFHCSMS